MNATTTVGAAILAASAGFSFARICAGKGTPLDRTGDLFSIIGLIIVMFGIDP